MQRKRQVGIKNENKHLKLNIQLFASDAEVKFTVVLDENEAEKSIARANAAKKASL